MKTFLYTLAAFFFLCGVVEVVAVILIEHAS